MMHDDNKKMHKEVIKFMLWDCFDHVNKSQLITRFVMLLRIT